MRIKKIAIKNLNSLHGLHEIDFEKSPLLDSELVAIVGATGSGKSTIMDAILLALFNQTPRYSKVSTSELQATGGLITKGQQSAMASIEYEVVINGEISAFCSTWTARKGLTGESKLQIQDYHMELASLPDKKIIVSGKSNRVVKKTEEIIGLDYEQFVKGVMLSQGDFSRFLRAKASERHELLEKITKTFDFRNISKAVYEEYKQKDTVVKELRSKRDSIEILNAEEKEALELSITAHQETLILLEKSLTETRKQKTLLEQIEQEKEKQAHTEKQIIEVAQEKENFQSEEKQLEKHQKALPLQGILSDFSQKEIRLQELENTLLSLEEQKKKKQERITELQEEETTATSKLKDFVAEEENLENLWTKVEELDAQILLLEESHKQTESLLQEKKEQFSESQSQHDAQKKELEANIEDLKKETDWTTKHHILNQAKVQFENIQSLETRSQDEKNVLENQIRTISDQKVQKTLLHAFEEETLYQNLSEWMKGMSIKIENFQKQLTYTTWNENTFDTEIERVKDLLHLQKERIKLGEKTTARQTELEECIQKSEDITQQIVVEEKKKTYTELQLKEKQATVHRLEFECSNHAIRLRSELLENQPCSVCGSLEHPYANKDISEEQEMLKATKKAVIQLENDMESLTKTVQNTQLEKAKLEGEINHKKAELLEIKNQSEVCKQEFTDILAQKEHLVLTEKDDLELWQTDLDKQREAYKGIQHYSSLLTLFSSLKNQVASYQKNEDAYQKIIIPYESYLEKGTDSLKNWIEDFSQKENTIENLKSVQVRFISQLESGQLELQKLEKEINHLAEKTHSEQTKIQEQKTIRTDLFGNKFVKQARQHYATEKDKFKDNLHSITQQLVEQTATLTALIKNTNETISLKETTQHSFIEVSKQLDASLKSKNFSNVEELQEAILAEDVATKITEQQTRLKRQEIELQTAKTTIEENILKYQKELSPNTEHSLEALSVEISEKENTQKEHQSAIGQETQKIQQSAENELKSQDQLLILEEKEKELKIWLTLNKLIGDSKGNTFNNYAQGLMLNILLEYANKHLSDLNKRYLFTPMPKGGSTDDLYIKDMEMGGEKRAIRTLSGGETFLLSLSLALGLSDMASHSVRIESLFIDEGFGTLDKETLEEVLNTLDVLQSKTGKKIMIISHVPELQERISTQIQLKKLGNGFSQLTIIPH